MTDGPYELPPGWRWVRLGEVAKAVNGYGFPKKFQGSKRLPIPFVKVSDLNKTENEREVTCAENYVDDDILSSLQARAYDPGTVVFPKIGGAIATNKKRKLGVRATFDNNIMGLVPDVSLVDTDYLLYFMNTVDLRKLSQVGPVPSIRQSAVNVIPLPLPPLEEQRRIVARIEDLMGKIREARRLREEAKHDADQLMPAALAEVFPRPGSSLSSGWHWAKLGDICQHRAGTWGPEAAENDGFPVVRSTEIAGNRIRPETASARVISPDRAEAFVLVPGDILVNKSSGSPHLVGWPAIFEGAPDNRVYLFSNFMIRLRTATDVAEPWFLLHYLHSPMARSIYLGSQDTTSGLRNLRVREFMALPVPLPPLEEQRRIVAHLDAVQEKAKALKQAQAETDAELRRLEQSILAAVFRGEL